MTNFEPSNEMFKLESACKILNFYMGMFGNLSKGDYINAIIGIIIKNIAHSNTTLEQYLIKYNNIVEQTILYIFIRSRMRINHKIEYKNNESSILLRDKFFEYNTTNSLAIFNALIAYLEKIASEVSKHLHQSNLLYVYAFHIGESYSNIFKELQTCNILEIRDYISREERSKLNKIINQLISYLPSTQHTYKRNIDEFLLDFDFDFDNDCEPYTRENIDEDIEKVLESLFEEQIEDCKRRRV